MVWPQKKDFDDAYIVTDLMEADLSAILSSKQQLSDTVLISSISSIKF